MQTQRANEPRRVSRPEKKECRLILISGISVTFYMRTVSCCCCCSCCCNCAALYICTNIYLLLLLLLLLAVRCSAFASLAINLICLAICCISHCAYAPCIHLHAVTSVVVVLLLVVGVRAALVVAVALVIRPSSRPLSSPLCAVALTMNNAVCFVFPFGWQLPSLCDVLCTTTDNNLYWNMSVYPLMCLSVCLSRSVYLIVCSLCCIPGVYAIYNATHFGHMQILSLFVFSVINSIRKL